MAVELTEAQVKEALSRSTTVPDLGRNVANAVDLLLQRARETMDIAKKLDSARFDLIQTSIKDIKEGLDEVWRMLMGEVDFTLDERKEIAEAFRDVHSSIASAISSLSPKGYGFTSNFDTRRGILLVKIAKLKEPSP